jgi:hypothetical protein
MSSVGHDHEQLVAYALGALDPAEARVVHAHVAGCAECQHEVRQLTGLRAALDEVPPEAFLDGPPPDGDLLLRKTLRRVRDDTAPPRRWTPTVITAAAAAVAVAVAGGVLVGRQTAPDQVVGAPTTTPPADARTAEVTDPNTGASMTVTLQPKAGWVWVTANVSGVQAGARCELWVVPREGERLLAGSWLVSEQGASEGTRLEGTALIDPADVASVDVATTDGQTMVSVPL